MGRLALRPVVAAVLFAALVTGVSPPVSSEEMRSLPEIVTLSRWEYLDLCYKAMTCGMRCGSEPTLLYCDSHILRTGDGGVAEFAYWWKTSGMSEKDLRAKLAWVNGRIPVMFRQSLPVRQGFWPAGPLEDRLLVVHLDGEKGGVIGMFCGSRGGYAPEEIASVEGWIRERGTVPVL